MLRVRRTLDGEVEDRLALDHDRREPFALGKGMAVDLEDAVTHPQPSELGRPTGLERTHKVARLVHIEAKASPLVASEVDRKASDSARWHRWWWL